MLMVGFHGSEIPESLVNLLQDELVTGVIWFRRNIVDTKQVARVNKELRRLRPELLIAVDQEGGPVRRLREGVTDIPAMRQIRGPEDAEAIGGILGRELFALGFNMNLAPVLDVDSNPANPIIGERSFGAKPEWVAELGIALHRGLTAAGVASCGKHFPGHGDTDLDSHLDLPVLPHEMDRLERVELPPFAAAIAAGIPALMSAHILLPALDPKVPATLSPTILKTLLRSKLGFDGLILSDDLEMQAVADRFSVEELTKGCVQAGVDLLLICHEFEKQKCALRVLRTLAPARIQASLDRIRKITTRFPGNN